MTRPTDDKRSLLLGCCSVLELVGVRLYNINKQFLLHDNFKSHKISYFDLLQTDLSSFLLIGKNATYGLPLLDLLFPHTCHGELGHHHPHGQRVRRTPGRRALLRWIDDRCIAHSGHRWESFEREALQVLHG